MKHSAFLFERYQSWQSDPATGATSCGCQQCQVPCRHMPGMLIPDDLPGYMVATRAGPLPQDLHPWAEANLLASPGARVIINGQPRPVPSLIPKTTDQGGCIHHQANGKCNIHELAPYGCAMFSICEPRPYDEERSLQAQIEIIRAWDNPLTETERLYTQLWNHLDAQGLREERSLKERRDKISDELAHLK